jgi:transmembrane sensor
VSGRSLAALTPAVREAIEWSVRLGSGAATAADRDAFEQWQALDASHRQAWQAVTQATHTPLNPLLEVPGSASAATRALRSSGLSLQRRRLLRGGSALLLMLGLPALLTVQRRMPLDAMFSDHYSGTGERRRIQLADGSVLLLNARTTVEVAFSAEARVIHLRHGELNIQVARDPHRPLEVVTAQGRVRALGTRFSVATLDQRSAVSVQQHSVQVRNRAGQSIVVDSGQTLRFADDALSPLGNEQGRLDAWMEGRLEVDDASLGSVIDALRPYRYGVLRVSPAAAQLRVFGVFPLDDSDRALQSLAQVLPISVEAFGPITLIDLR